MVRAVSVCECIRRLRSFKNEALYDFYKRMEIPEPGVLGIFGIEVPEEEDVADALEMLRSSLENYTKDCPWAITPEARELAEKLESLTTKKATLRKVLSGEYGWYFQDLIMKAEKFMISALEGLAEETEGPKREKGPFSSDIQNRHTCLALLNNIEACKVEIKAMAEDAEGYMSPPEYLINKMDELNESQREFYKDYLRLCKVDAMGIGSELESYGRGKESKKETLERFDKWTEEHEEELKREMEKWYDRMSGRDHWLWEIEEAIASHQGPMNVFLETEWSNLCESLKWKEPKKKVVASF